MIYSASLGLPVKKAFKTKAMQSSVPKITSLLNEDPEITTMDTVVLGPKDSAGPRGKQLVKAIPKAHPSICIIYIYSKSSEEDFFECENKVLLKRMSPANVQEAVEDFIKDHTVRTGRARVTSADFTDPDEDDGVDFGTYTPEEEEPTEYQSPTQFPKFSTPSEFEQNDNTDNSEEDDTVGTSVPIPDFIQEEEQPELPKQPLQSVIPTQEPHVSSMPKLSIEDAISGVRSTEDWEVLKSSLRKETIYRQLIEENTEFNGLINVIDTLDCKISAVWRDPALSAEMKFDQIKQIGLDRSVAVATANSITTTKIIDIISRITLAAKRTVEDKLASYDAAMCKVATCKTQMTDTSQIDHAIQERANAQLELLALSRNVVDLYNAMHLMVTEEINDLDAKLPSSNEFINNMVRPIGTQIFTPRNTAELADKLMKALQDNRITSSQLETKVNAVIEVMFKLFEQDSEIINYQQNLIAMLRAHHVEEVVIVDSVIKHMLRIFTGADGTGRTATAITWCGIMSRRQNCLLIDLTGKSKFAEYGITPMTLDDFMKNRVKEQFLCVEASRIPAPDELQEIIGELKTRLDYYPYVNLIMDPDDIDGLEQASTDALSVNYICNCTKESMEVMRNTIANHTYKNIARKLVLIDPPISPLSICDALGVDPTMFKLCIVPNMPEIRACAIQHDRPWEYEQVVRIYEEAFR